MNIQYDKLDVEYDRVIIIDGLPVNEREDWKISNNLREFLAANGIDQLGSSCNNKAMLVKTLFLLEWMSKNGQKFCIHIICHGNNEGIGIKSTGEMIYWNEFRNKLGTINNAMGGTLIVNMSSCFGLHGIKIVDKNKNKYPFFGLIGPSEKIGAATVKEINEKFYSKQLEGKEIQNVVKEINQEAGKDVLYCITSQGYRSISRTQMK